MGSNLGLDVLHLLTDSLGMVAASLALISVGEVDSGDKGGYSTLT